MALQSPSQTDSDELNKLKRKCGCLRGAVTKQITKIESDILKPDITVEDLEESIELLTERGEELKLIDSQVESLIQVDQIEVEFESIEEYKEKITRTRFKTRKLIQKISKGSNANNSWQDSNISLNSMSQNETQTKEKERIKLPKLTIPKFYGEISEWANVKCDLCSGRHVTVMCMGKGKAREDFSKAKNNDSVLSNASIRKRVMLQTIIVKISGAKQKHMIRLIIDSGSSGSYISEFAARKLQLKDIGHETVVHGLFGGLQKKEKHKKYVINLSNVDNSFDCALNVMEQKTICAPIPKLENMKLIEEIKNYGIDLSDLTVNENFCLYESNVNEIHGLIGADYAGKLFTGEIKNLPSGLVAMNTYFGWTIMGRTGEGCSASEVLLSLHVSDLRICDLWSLDSLGIKEPSISQSKSEIEEAVKDHFLRSLRRDDEGRYQVSLPWLEVHPELSDNRNIAERRLKSCVRSLQKRNCLQEYENIFKEWVSEKIIESVEPGELDRKKGKLETDEIKSSERVILKEIQREVFSGGEKKLYPLEVTTADSLSSTERDVENGSCLDQDQIHEVQGVLRSRYGRLLKQTKRLDNP
ncbi:DUF1758 domain-containing protein [Trichonephila clavata]|uniref:DUF1758 domain-containing protein n=1 Tax=Trichonephila clavata TaxID=2740835 RepID=A0A8X6GXX7_TRICU|nr:DUF1758 domain-containing protein [Trichonephila clavata]